MSDHRSQRPPLARNVSVLVGGVVVVELVFALFLFVMTQQASPVSSGTGRALLFGAAASAVAAVVAVVLWASARSAEAQVTLPVWTARVLPVVAIAVALVGGASGGIPWLAVPSVCFATTPVCVVALVVRSCWRVAGMSEPTPSTVDGRHYSSGVSITKVSVIGASGRMGSEVCRAVEAAGDLQLVGGFDMDDDLDDLAGADVVVEFSIPDASATNVAHCVDQGIHVVVGTTGWSDDKLADLRTRLEQHPDVGVLVAPNFAIGAVLMMAFAQKAAEFYESVEVIELHHPDKVDAPSGTAAHTAALIGAARAQAGLADVPDATTSDPHGARGARAHGIPVHSVRLRGLVAHQEVLFGQTGEMLTIRHDSFDRVSFMPGVVAAVRKVDEHPGLTVGLEHYLGI